MSTKRMQNLILSAPHCNSEIQTIVRSERDLSEKLLLPFQTAVTPLGIAGGYSPEGQLVAIAIAAEREQRELCLIVRFETERKNGQMRLLHNEALIEMRKILEEMVLCRDVGELFAFDMGSLSMSLYSDLDHLRISQAVDIQSAFVPHRDPLAAIKRCLGDSGPRINEKSVNQVFKSFAYSDSSDDADLFQRAWIARFVATYENGAQVFDRVKRINTHQMPDITLKIVAKLTMDSHQQDSIQKTSDVAISFAASRDAATGDFQGHSNVFKNKFRKQQNLHMQVQTPNGDIVLQAQTGQVDGRNATINVKGGNDLLQSTDKVVTTIISKSAGGPTQAELKRTASVLAVLQGSSDLLQNPWIQSIWFPQEILTWPDHWSQKNSSALDLDYPFLNPSQQQAVDTMLSNDSLCRITVIQGPPGTGKTSVIGSYVQNAIKNDITGIWLSAQSNVAVKNIAEKLLSIGFTQWRLLVSEDFHHSWHEHIYHKVQDFVIRSEEFAKLAPHRLIGCKVILCTLSMLSNFFIKKFTSVVPFKILIIDEASQIEIGSYFTIFHHLGSSLRKLCFIGDDKQLPPFGQEDIEDLQSIFELEHLHSNILFLDTQYRMPPQLGHFISGAVYNSRLQSNPLHPITDKIMACKFIDLPSKEQKEGSSLKNPAEAQAIIYLAQILQEQEKSYKIITPYDGQRNLIEDMMKNTEGLAWKDKCFNVDSFQGNEDDYIIISVVRSRDLGFLKNIRRTNVMLTRCKRGMYIVSSKAFLTGVGANCLVGELEKYCGLDSWVTLTDLKEGRTE